MITTSLWALGSAGLVAGWYHLSVRRDMGKAVLLLSGAFAVIGCALLGFLGIAGALVPLIAIRLISFRQKLTHKRRVDDATPETFEALADAIRAKGSLRLGVAELAVSGPRVTREAFRAIQTRLESGIELPNALDVLHEYLGSIEAREAVLAMRLHLASGGDLSESLEMIAERSRDRLSIERELTAMTAQGKLSGLVMALAAPGFALITHSLGLGGGFLIRSPAGVALLFIGLLLDASGYFWMKKICEVAW